MVKIENIMTKFLNVIGILIIIEFTVIIFFQVILRYFFNTTLSWGYEITTLSLVYLTFIGVALSSVDDSHIRITFLHELLPKKAVNILDLIVDILCIFFIVFVSLKSLEFIANNFDITTTALNIPLSYIYGIFPITGIFMVFFMMMNISRNIKSLFKSEKN